ncbi:MAG: succinylglutamate desuccinylase/aspartoacylase family protein [Pseudomonadota bacterium]
MSLIHLMEDPDPSMAAGSPEAFLKRLDGPAAFLFKGKDQSRTRAFVTLLHGNEPSGIYALRHWILSEERPAVNLLCIVASVHAALEPPGFSARMLPRARDLNRCFRPPFDDQQGRLAADILELLKRHEPEAVIDMHNTSGSGPAFGVCTHLDPQHDALVSLFTRRLVVSHLNLGALMEISDEDCPTVTVEVGGRLDEDAHELAIEGLARYARAETVLVEETTTAWGLEYFEDPIRLELKGGATLAYGEGPRRGYDITLRLDIEHHNFGIVSSSQQLGWISGNPIDLFSATDANGRCAVSSIVRVEDGQLYPASDLKLFMITTNAGIAEADCLFYAVEADGTPIPAR